MQDDARDRNNHDYGSRQQREINIKSRRDDGREEEEVKEEEEETLQKYVMKERKERKRDRRRGFFRTALFHARRGNVTNQTIKPIVTRYTGESLQSVVECDPLVRTIPPRKTDSIFARFCREM